MLFSLRSQHAITEGTIRRLALLFSAALFMTLSTNLSLTHAQSPPTTVPTDDGSGDVSGIIPFSITKEAWQSPGENGPISYHAQSLAHSTLDELKAHYEQSGLEVEVVIDTDKQIFHGWNPYPIRISTTWKLTGHLIITCLLYTSPSPRDKRQSRMPSSA